MSEGEAPRRPRGPRKGRLAELPLEDRPREKLFSRGAEALSDEELLALLLGTGRAGRPILEICSDLLRDGGLAALFARGDPRRLVSGLGPAKAARIAAVCELSRRHLGSSFRSRDLLSSPEAVAQYLMAGMARETREVMGGLLLDAKNRLIRDAVVFRGTGTFAAVAPSPLFRQAILDGAEGVVLYHNHPSGDPEPSPEDRATTERFVKAGGEIGIPVRDHLVIGRGAWVSFRQRGWIP